MVYRKMGRSGVEVSALGYGCMRYPRAGGRIDAQRATRQIRSAIDRGVNYFDTAYYYDGGQNEAILGSAIAGPWRDKIYIADKIPPYMVFSNRDIGRLFDTMLKRLRTDRIDFLLAHMLCDFASWERLKSLGYIEFMEKAREEGRARWLGFSWHGTTDDFKRVVDDYAWDFCQIQYNYLDEHYQAGRGGLVHAHNAGLGVVVMEPLRGGSLAGRLPEEAAKVMSSAPVGKSAAAWALDWIWDHEEVACVLSGLNEEAHIDEDIRLAEASAPGRMSEAERAVIASIRDTFQRLTRVGCTGCRYCMPCPFGVDIPYAFSMLNARHLFDDSHVRFQYTLFTSGLSGGKSSGANLCTQCGACEKKCPQHIPIRSELKAVRDELEVKALRPAVALLRALRALVGKLRPPRT